MSSLFIGTPISNSVSKWTRSLRIFDFGAGDNPSQLFELCPLFQLTRVTFDPALPYSAQKGAKKNSLTSGLYHAAGFLGPHTQQKRLELMIQRCKSRMYFNGRNPENVVFYRFHGEPGPSGPPWVSPCVCVLKTQILMHGDCECPISLYSGKRLTQATTKIIQAFMIPLAQRLSFQ